MDIKCVGVIGAGTMGSGIAQVMATAGFNTILIDRDDIQVAVGLSRIKHGLEKAVQKGKLSAEEMERVRGLIEGKTDLGSVADCDLIVEAVPEDLKIKTQIFHYVAAICVPETIIASNTSSISITAMAAATTHPEQFIGMHFMNPAPVMSLVEVIRGLKTSEETFQKVWNFAKRLGKTPVASEDRPGFIVNRIIMPMINEAFFALMEGVASAEDIDTAITLGTNEPMGPLALADLIGLDTVLYILEVLHREMGEDKYRPCPLLRKYVEAGWLGKKVGHGVYDY
ncbi:MAG: 3-hydroxybutyryl-CoA dehydrogenase [Nitrospirota bacterium]|nr:3-hydroxybutyryl-CoA dehydrogenase [Nitrospirota bacterium]